MGRLFFPVQLGWKVGVHFFMTTVFVTDERFDGHTMPGHPEHAGRLQAVRCCLTGLAERMTHLETRPATREDLLAVHSNAHLDLLDRFSSREHITMIGLDTYVTPGSYELARLAAGGVLQVVDAVLTGEAGNGLAAIRPPGHHATPNHAMGFCLLNNVAIAARYAQRTHGIERVLIVDYDVHHGNGTQDAFFADPSVLYISTHQSPLYPGTGEAHETGTGAGSGTTLNIPLPPGTGDAGFYTVFEELVLPVARRFEPELVLLSVGFDAHWRDPLADLQLSLTGYDHLTRMMLAAADEWCQGHIVGVMEGGYDLDVLSAGWANMARAFLGDDGVVDELGVSNRSQPSLAHALRLAKRFHKLT